MPEQIKVEHIQLNNATIAQMFKLPQQMIDYLWERIDIAKKKQVCLKDTLAGNISNSYKLDDPQNLFIRNLYNILCNPVDNPIMFEFINKEVENIYTRFGTEMGCENHT